MPKNKKIPEKYQIWIDARKAMRLSHVHVQMAKELGLNPKKLGKLNNHDQESWKAPLPVFLQDLYFKRFHKFRPEKIRTIEEIFKDDERKKEEKRERKRLQKLAEDQASPPEAQARSAENKAGPIKTGFSDQESLILESDN